MAKTSHKITINAPKSRVFDALSTKDDTPQVEGEVGEGETVVLGFKDEVPFHWRFVEVASPTRIKWECVEGPGAVAGTRVDFRLSDRDGRTSVECDHEGFREADRALRSCNTLWGILMGCLRDYAETPKPRPGLPISALMLDLAVPFLAEPWRQAMFESGQAQAPHGSIQSRYR
jgi:uncharacterized protein YndB with AHSA1/START domain